MTDEKLRQIFSETYNQMISFLKNNGWEFSESVDEYATYIKGDSIAVAIHKEEGFVFIDGSGDILHEPLNFHALVGALIMYRQLPYNFKN